MPLSVTAYASKAITRDDGKTEWSQPNTGILTVDNETVTFADWSISTTSIDKATLNTVWMLNTKRQHLTLHFGENSYRFILRKPVEKTFNFSFDVLETTEHSMPNKLLIGATIFFLINMIIILAAVWLKD
jgi:hypothetical protein